MRQRLVGRATVIATRVGMRAVHADGDVSEIIMRGFARLIGEAEMGNLFKVMVGTSPELATPYPFGRS